MRGGIKRSRTGCARCKERKLKCDETRPRCIRCQKRNTICPGYSQLTEVATPEPFSQSDFSTSVPVDDTTSVGHHDIFDFDPLATDSIFDVPWSTAEDHDWEDTSPKVFEATSSITIPATTATAAASIADNGVTSSTSLIRRGRSQSFAVEAIRKSAQLDPMSSSENPSRGMNDYSSLLVEYYFKEVAGIFSCYDSHFNPFRSTVSKLWQTSNSVFYVLQSMAAACLSDVVPSLHTVGDKLRHAAMTCVEADIRDSKVETGSLLTLIMLGLSASWHNPNDLGREHFNQARTIMAALTTGQTPAFLEVNNKRNLQFFKEAMIYWEMLLSYVSDVSVALPLTQGPEISSSDSHDMLEPSFPHPWTGVAREAQVLVFEVGRLVRKERQRIKNRPLFTSLADIDESYKVINKAEELAQRLRGLQLPAEEAIINPGDVQTPVKHLITIAELYRLTGLLQLYRVFPDLLSDYGTDRAQLDFYDPDRISPDGMNQRLTAFAVEIVDLLRTLPIESATKCVQPFFFVAVASELTIPSASEQTNGLVEGIEPAVAGPSAVEVLDARKFVISRLSTFEHVLPAKPLRQMIQIVTLTWEHIDKGMADVYWMDVMTDKGWETTLG
ncbi:fungal-specific transcription factor domain-containing protein [Exophiala viscosa]|uniref:Fungal-specific transcription factor domain-containing protein n=1 Tax=Exophiala viscosa TaxID=2486360 RepID=A0AAN6ICR0_9EURO|nr:fungal-specific transcription factor domain-containing protein [Exophiala viscosa]KAI1625711.1 fungal-specific transcription factor domain-containing protein [Exophiala viscosa]